MLGSAHKAAGKPRKREIGIIKCTKMSQGSERDEIIQGLQNNSHEVLILAFLKEDHLACVFTDGSESLCARIMTETHENQSLDKLEKQRPEPMIFLTCAFTVARKD